MKLHLLLEDEKIQINSNVSIDDHHKDRAANWVLVNFKENKDDLSSVVDPFNFLAFDCGDGVNRNEVIDYLTQNNNFYFYKELIKLLEEKYEVMFIYKQNTFAKFVLRLKR